MFWRKAENLHKNNKQNICGNNASHNESNHFPYICERRYIFQEEVTSKTIALAIKTAKLDGKVLQAALRQFMQLYRKKRDTPHRGKQTLKQLMRHGTGVSNIEITDANIKAFSQTAKKYGVDFALKKTDDRYLVFFKGRDADVLTAAFREFSAKKLDMERKPSVRRDIGEKKAEAAKLTAARDTVKKMDRGIDR